MNNAGSLRTPFFASAIKQRFGVAARAVACALAAAACLLLAAPAAHAQQKGPIVLDVITITGRVQKPVAAVDVSRIAPKLTLMELKQPFLERIEEATKREPF